MRCHSARCTHLLHAAHCFFYLLIFCISKEGLLKISTVSCGSLAGLFYSWSYHAPQEFHALSEKTASSASRTSNSSITAPNLVKNDGQQSFLHIGRTNQNGKGKKNKEKKKRNQLTHNTAPYQSNPPIAFQNPAPPAPPAADGPAPSPTP